MAIAANGSKATAGKPGRRLRIPLSLKFATVMVLLALLLLALSAAAGLWWAYSGVERTRFRRPAAEGGNTCRAYRRQALRTEKPDRLDRPAGVEKRRHRAAARRLHPHAQAIPCRHRALLHRRQWPRAAQGVALRAGLHRQPDEPRQRAALQRDGRGEDLVRPGLCPQRRRAFDDGRRGACRRRRDGRRDRPRLRRRSRRCGQFRKLALFSWSTAPAG